MSNYYLILVWIGFVVMFSAMTNIYRKESVCGKMVWRVHPIWALIIVLPLIIWSANRGYVADTGLYITQYKSMPSSFLGIVSYMENVKKDKGFYLFSAILKVLLGSNHVWYLLVIAIIQVLLLTVVYRKYSINFILSFFLFIVSTDYVSWIFNGMRQFLAVTITFACFGLILKKKYIPAVLLTLFVAQFHGSALLVIPFIFIVQGKAWNKKTLLFLIGILLTVSFADRFTNILDTLLVDTQYENVVSDWENWQDDGTNVIRVLIYSLPVILALIGRKRISLENNQVINICINMSIASMGFYIVSMFTSGIFIGRLPIYFSLYNYILLPWEIENIFDKKLKNTIYMAMIAAYLLFYYYQIHLTWGLA